MPEQRMCAIKTKKNIIYFSVIAFLLIAAVFFKFALIGYGFLAFMLMFAAIIVGAYFVLSLKNTKPFKILKIILTAAVAALLTVLTVSEAFVVSYSFKREKAASPYAIVLGAGVHGTTPSRVLRERINAAYEFLTAYPETKAILSGGQGPGEDISEAECIKRELVKLGIDESRLFIEDRSTSTRENLQFSKQILETIAPDETAVTVISSETHLYRACYLAREYGLEAKGYYAKTEYVVLRFSYMLREGFAVWKDWIL